MSELQTSAELQQAHHYDQSVEEAFIAGALALLEYAQSIQREEILMSGLRMDGVVPIAKLETWCHGDKANE